MYFFEPKYGKFSKLSIHGLTNKSAEWIYFSVPNLIANEKKSYHSPNKCKQIHLGNLATLNIWPSKCDFYDG